MKKFYFLFFDQRDIRGFFSSEEFARFAEQQNLCEFETRELHPDQKILTDLRKNDFEKSTFVIVRRNGYSPAINSFAERIQEHLFQKGCPPCAVKHLFIQDNQLVTSIDCGKKNATEATEEEGNEEPTDLWI